MNTISTSAPPARIRHLSIIAKAARKLGDMIAPRSHAGTGNWGKDSDIPWQAWPLGTVLAAFFIWGWDVLNWLLHLVL